MAQIDLIFRRLNPLQPRVDMTDSPLVTIRHYPGILNSPGLDMAVFGWHELMLKGYTDPGAVVIAFDHKAIVAFEDGEPVGLLTYVDQEWAQQLWICLAYVTPARRRRGIHSKHLWPALIGTARELKRGVIASGAHVNNVISRAMMISQGRVETMVYTRYVIKPGE
jgi:GNAT superfamily N-acetyltransferase